MLTRREYYKLVIFFSIIIAIVIIQYFISDSLQRMSIPIIRALQSDPYLVRAMTYVSDLGSKKIKSLLLVLVFSECNLYHSFLYSVVCYTSIILCSWLKIILQEPRPFWLDDSITAYDCEAGYGYPSNHVLTTVPSFFMFFEILYYHYKIDRTVNSKIFYWVGFAVNLIVCILVGLSRMVLGVHSLDQVFFGLLMGFASYYFYLHIIDYDIRNYHPFLQEISNAFSKARMLLIFLGLYIAFLINIAFTNIYYDPIWTTRIIKDCGQLPPMTPFYKCIADSGDYFVLYGMLLGIFYDIHFNYKKKYNTDKLPIQFIYENISDTVFTTHMNENRTGKWNDTSSTITTIRLFVLYFCFCFLFTFPKLAFYIFEENNLLNYFIFNKMLPCLIAGFFTFSFSKTLCYYLKLTNLKDNIVKNI